jgi:hypothetical protein
MRYAPGDVFSDDFIQNVHSCDAEDANHAHAPNVDTKCDLSWQIIKSTLYTIEHYIL